MLNLSPVEVTALLATNDGFTRIGPVAFSAGSVRWEVDESGNLNRTCSLQLISPQSLSPRLCLEIEGVIYYCRLLSRSESSVEVTFQGTDAAGIMDLTSFANPIRFPVYADAVPTIRTWVNNPTIFPLGAFWTFPNNMFLQSPVTIEAGDSARTGINKLASASGHSPIRTDRGSSVVAPSPGAPDAARILVDYWDLEIMLNGAAYTRAVVRSEITGVTVAEELGSGLPFVTTSHQSLPIGSAENQRLIAQESLLNRWRNNVRWRTNRVLFPNDRVILESVQPRVAIAVSSIALDLEDGVRNVTGSSLTPIWEGGF